MSGNILSATQLYVFTALHFTWSACTNSARLFRHRESSLIPDQAKNVIYFDCRPHQHAIRTRLQQLLSPISLHRCGDCLHMSMQGARKLTLLFRAGLAARRPCYLRSCQPGISQDPIIHIDENTRQWCSVPAKDVSRTPARSGSQHTSEASYSLCSRTCLGCRAWPGKG